MTGGIRPWEIYWDRMWALGFLDRVGPKGLDYLWDKYGRVLEPPEEDETGWHEVWEYDPSP